MSFATIILIPCPSIARTDNMAALIRDSSTVKVGDGEVTVRGWIQDTRNLGGISFIALRDRYGVIQLTLPKMKIEP